MKRLRDEATDDPLSERGFELLRDTPPTPPVPEMRRRVWNALQRQAQPRASGVFVGARGLKVFAMGATVLALAGTAGAMIGDRLIVPALERAAGSSGPAVRPAHRRDRSRSAGSAAGARVPGTTAPEAPAPASATPELAPRADDVASSRATRRSSPASAARAVARPAAVASAKARTQVLDALVALRRDRDPVRAGELLDRYLSLPGRGALREEALALAIEAADARADQAQARRYAQVYEAEYPRGRFGSFARSHTDAHGSRLSSPSAAFEDTTLK